MSHASGPRWASPEHEYLVRRTRTCTSYGHDILRRTKVARPTQPPCVTVLKGACSIAGLWRIEPQVLMSAQGICERAAADSSRRVSLHWRGGWTSTSEVEVEIAARHKVVPYLTSSLSQVSPPARSSSKRQRYPVLAVAHVPGALRSSRVVAGTRTWTEC